MKKPALIIMALLLALFAFCRNETRATSSNNNRDNRNHDMEHLPTRLAGVQPRGQENSRCHF